MAWNYRRRFGPIALALLLVGIGTAIYTFLRHDQRQSAGIYAFEGLDKSIGQVVSTLESLASQAMRPASSVSDKAQLEAAKKQVEALQKQLADLEEKRKAYEDLLIHRDSEQSKSATFSLVALMLAVGTMISGLSTFTLAWRKDRREEIETRAKVSEVLLKVSDHQSKSGRGAALS